MITIEQAQCLTYNIKMQVVFLTQERMKLEAIMASPIKKPIDLYNAAEKVAAINAKLAFIELLCLGTIDPYNP